MELETKDDGVRAPVREKFERISDAEREVAATVTLEELVREGSDPSTAAVKVV